MTYGNRWMNLCQTLKTSLHLEQEKLGIDYRIHSADEYILVSGMEEAVLIYMEAIRNLLCNLEKAQDKISKMMYVEKKL